MVRRTDSHTIGARYRLLSHLIYAEALRRDPSLLDRARELVADRLRSDECTFTDRMWAVLLTLSLEEVIRGISSDAPEGDDLRSNSPFSILIGLRDVEERNALWRRASLEVRREQDG